MRTLDEMSFGNRIALTFVIVLIILLAMAFIGWISGGWDAEAKAQAKQKATYTVQSATTLYESIPLDGDLLPIDRRALNEAYHGHLVKLWNVWLSDGAGDPTRFRNGLSIARGAYRQASAALNKREQELGK